jgi:hypothetical protein
MGEYARYQGQEIKIGTCEDMYYLRADQVCMVSPEYGNVDPLRDARSLRFRFPFPDEDGIEPGAFDDHDRGLTVRGATAPEVDHYSVQFSASNGYLVSLPCPEGIEHLTINDQVTTIHRNGYGGAVEIVQQRIWEDRLVLVCGCKGCGARWRCETLADAQSVLDGLTAMEARERETAERNNTPGNAATADRYAEVARRIRAGYEPGAVDIVRRLGVGVPK